jgi:hypothetical protein
LRFYSLVLSGLLSAPTSLYAISPDFHGSFSLNETEYTYSGARIENESSAWLWLKADIDIGEDFSIKAKGWAQGKKNKYGDEVEEELLEAYAEYFSDALTFTVGRQIIAWGRADSLNPTDNLTPRDYSLSLLEDSEQRFGADSLIFKYSENDAELSFVLIGEPKANVLPLEFSLGTEIDDVLPENPAGALKLNVVKPSLDWSGSYYDGFDLMPNIGINPASLTVTQQYDRKQVIGGDAATTIGRYGIRIEAAYSIFPETPFVGFFEKKDQAYWILGADRSITENINVNMQVYGKKTFDFLDREEISVDYPLGQLQMASAILAGQLYDHDSGLTCRIYNKWLNETLTAELLSVYSTSHHDRLFRARISYAINDHLKLSVGSDRFIGASDTFFGNNEFLSFSQAEIKLLF